MNTETSPLDHHVLIVRRLEERNEDTTKQLAAAKDEVRRLSAELSECERLTAEYDVAAKDAGVRFAAMEDERDGLAARVAEPTEERDGYRNAAHSAIDILNSLTLRDELVEQLEQANAEVERLRGELAAVVEERDHYRRQRNAARMNADEDSHRARARVECLTAELEWAAKRMRGVAEIAIKRAQLQLDNDVVVLLRSHARHIDAALAQAPALPGEPPKVRDESARWVVQRMRERARWLLSEMNAWADEAEREFSATTGRPESPLPDGWKAAALSLWALLDSIDTLDDAAKGDDALFRKRCYQLQRRRFAILSGASVDAARSEQPARAEPPTDHTKEPPPGWAVSHCYRTIPDCAVTLERAWACHDRERAAEGPTEQSAPHCGHTRPIIAGQCPTCAEHPVPSVDVQSAPACPLPDGWTEERKENDDGGWWEYYHEPNGQCRSSLDIHDNGDMTGCGVPIASMQLIIAHHLSRAHQGGAKP